MDEGSVSEGAESAAVHAAGDKAPGEGVPSADGAIEAGPAPEGEGGAGRPIVPVAPSHAAGDLWADELLSDDTAGRRAVGRSPPSCSRI